MDKAQILVRMVARAFYDPEAVVIVDALVRHIAMSYSDIQYIFGNAMKAKGHLLTFIGQLKSGGLIREFTRDELKANAQKAVKVTYYYIDYRHAVDATKYRLWMLGVRLRKEAGPLEEKKEYKCPRCKSEFREIDVIGNPSADMSTFICLTCGSDLEYIEQGNDDIEATGPVGAFNKSLGWLINHMQVIDKVTIPATSAEIAFAQREEIPRPKAPLPNAATGEHAQSTQIKPQAVKGMITGPQKVEVTISSDAANTAAAQIAAAEQKERLARQNALPEWHTHSTISNEVTAVGQREEAARREREAESRLMSSGIDEEKKDVKDDGLDDIFAQIEKDTEQERLRKEQEEEEEYETDEEEDEFEDIPASSVGTNGAVNGNGGMPEAKKAKMEAETPVSQATPVSGMDGDEDEEDFEFEDA